MVTPWTLITQVEQCDETALRDLIIFKLFPISFENNLAIPKYTDCNIYYFKWNTLCVKEKPKNEKGYFQRREENDSSWDLYWLCEILPFPSDQLYLLSHVKLMQNDNSPVVFLGEMGNI